MTDEATAAGQAPAERSTNGAAENQGAADAPAAPPAGAETPPGNSAAGAEDAARLQALAAQNAELKDRLLRLQADFENFRKRKAREAEEIRAYAAANVLEDLLTVLDHLDLALDASHDRTDANWGKGIDLIARQLADALKANGLEEVSANPGDRFDPAWHEAVAEQEADGTPAGCIGRVTRKGYRIRDRLVRAAQVVVARERVANAQAGAGSPAAVDGGA